MMNDTLVKECDARIDDLLSVIEDENGLILDSTPHRQWNVT